MVLTPAVCRLDRRVVIVTGAAAGLGEAIALAVANFGAGVALCDRDAAGLERVAAEARATGTAVHTAVLDVRDADAVAAFVTEAHTVLGRIDVLVNNVGGGFHSAFLDLGANAQDALVRENFVSVTHCTRAAVALMGDGGSVINITSVEAHRAGPGYAVYSAMKAGVASLTKSLALELGDRGIRVNCVAPDVIPTPGVGDLPGVEDRTALTTRGHPDDVAAACVYLASDLGRFVTGTTIHVDGGTHAAGGWHRTPDRGWTT